MLQHLEQLSLIYLYQAGQLFLMLNLFRISCNTNCVSTYLENEIQKSLFPWLPLEGVSPPSAQCPVGSTCGFTPAFARPVRLSPGISICHLPEPPESPCLVYVTGACTHWGRPAPSASKPNSLSVWVVTAALLDGRPQQPQGHQLRGR